MKWLAQYLAINRCIAKNKEGNGDNLEKPKKMWTQCNVISCMDSGIEKGQ